MSSAGRTRSQLSVRRDAEDTDRRFRRRWALGTTGGWFGGFLVGFLVASGFVPLLGTGPWHAVLAYFILGLFFGAAVGFAQWLVLRRRVAGAGAWVLASALGMGFAGGGGYGLAVLIFGYSEGLEDLASFAAVLGWSLVVALGGAISGMLQWRVLRGRVEGAAWWVVVSTLGWGLSMAVAGGFIVAGFELVGVTPPGTLWFFGFLLVGGVTLGTLTAAPITRLSTRRTIDAPPNEA